MHTTYKYVKQLESIQEGMHQPHISMASASSYLTELIINKTSTLLVVLQDATKVQHLLAILNERTPPY